MEKDQKKYIGEKGFWNKWFSKLLFTLISVKVWGLVAGTWVSTYLLLTEVDGESYISNAQWLTFNTTIWALIFGMKEIFRITEKKDAAEQEIVRKKMDSEIKINTIRAAEKNNSNQSTFTAEGLEIVGEEPDA